MPPSASPLLPEIRLAAVIGAGTMGAAIAAHLTNAGVPTLLLDLATDSGNDRNAVARAGLERALRARPPAFMDPESTMGLLTLGNTTDDLAKLRDADWIIEAVIERPEAKQQLWEAVERHARPQAIFASNSSGITMSVQSRGRSPEFRRRFLGVHFYNPPRHLYLLELIPTAETAPEVLETVRAYGDLLLGKGIVLANDVPGFIGNRVGIYSLLQAVRVTEEMNLPYDAVDALTGPLLGRPKSGTLRLADTVGLDVLALISRDLTGATTDDYRLPAVLQRLLDRGARGEKTGGGFYQRRKNADGTSAILTLDPSTMEYTERPPAAARLPELAPILKLKSAAERTRALLALDTPAGEFSRRTLYEMIRFAAEKHGVVANTHQDIDHALEWGFGWELGPFRLVDALGLEHAAAAFARLGWTLPPILEKHRRENLPFYPAGVPDPGEDGLTILSDLKREAGRVVRQTSGASLVDLGGGALLLEFHSKANALGADAFAAVDAALEIVPRGFLGLVIGNQGRWFSAGADLGALLADAEAGNHAAIEAMIVGFQRMTTSLRAAPFPVVAAPFHMTLGGGCEMMLYSDAVQAHAELNTGLVELNVGLMPSAGGTTEMLARFLAALAPGEDPFVAVERAFDLIVSSRVTASALEARRLGFLRAGEGITMNRRRLLGDAKGLLLDLAADYRTPSPRSFDVLGEPAYERLMEKARARRSAGEGGEYDVQLASGLARILTGGGPGTRAGNVPDTRLYQLEREVFIDLCAQEATRARIRHVLSTGKPLRN